MVVIGMYVIAVRITLASTHDLRSSSKDDMVCEISGLIEANVRDLNSLPYRGLLVGVMLV